MIEVVTPDIAFLYRDKIDAMHCLRHRVFKERMNWAVNSRKGRERDVYDLMGPVYLIATGKSDEVCGTLRLLPTTGPYMLKDVFPQLMDGEEFPSDPQIWESSRLAVDTGLQVPDSHASSKEITNKLLAGMFECGLLFGIHEFVAVYDERVGRILRRNGCKLLWESRPKQIGETIALAGRLEVSEAVVEAVHRAGRVTEPVLAHQDALEVRHAA